MSITLTSVIADPPSGRSRAVLFDHHNYAQRIILQSKDVPWDPPMAYSNFYSQAQSLLTADVAVLDLGRYYGHCLEQETSLNQSMGAKPRTGFALRTLLGDPQLVQRAQELTTTFTKTQSAPVVLQIPSPMQWLGWTHHHVGAPGVADLDADDAEKASMYVADWVRSFAGLDLAGVLLDERQILDVDLPSVDVSVYSPVANVTEYYRWPLARRHADRVELIGQEEVGGVLTANFWLTEDMQLPEGDFLMTEIPRSAEPEEVVARVGLLS